jgi:salicylate hydroxylase
MALKAFEASRIPLVHNAMRTSEACGSLFAFLGSNGDNLEAVGQEIEELTSWIPVFDLDEMAANAVQMMTNLIAT